MSNLSSLLSERPIAFYPVLRKITGSIPAAIMLQQLLYWWERRQDETVYKTEAEMMQETSLTRHEQKHAIKLLKEAGFITVKLKGAPPVRNFIVHLDIIDQALKALIEEPESGDLKSRKAAIQRAGKRRFLHYTENTTEITTDNIPPLYPPNEQKAKKGIPYAKIVELWKTICADFPQPREITPTLKQSIKARWLENSERQNLEWWKGYFEYIAQSDFLAGRVNGWRASITWVLGPRNMTKVLSGQYDNTQGQKKQTVSQFVLNRMLERRRQREQQQRQKKLEDLK